MMLVVVPKSDLCGQNIIMELANKQDINGAIDELDLVENLDVECAANAMKCPTRVEICSCIWKGDQSKDNTIGIKNGYKWLLDIIVKNYTVLNSKVKSFQNAQSERNVEVQSSVLDTPSRLSIHSNPFKPIKELVLKKESNQAANITQNGIVTNGKKLKKLFTHRNKTAPLTNEESVIEIKDISENVKFMTETESRKSFQALPPILNPVTLDTYSNTVRLKINRPYTAPESSHFINKITVINMPGQVTQE